MSEPVPDRPAPMEPTEAMKALARKCAAKYWQTGDRGDEAAARSILSGDWDDQAYTQAALAAIMETQETCARLAEERRDDILADAIRRGDALARDRHG